MMIGTKQEVIKFLETARNGLYKIKAHFRSRSIPQNSYLHLIFTFLEEFWDTGHTSDEWKEIFKSKYLRTYSHKFQTTYIKPTKYLSSKEMTDFIENIRVWSADFLKIKIPNPEEKRMIDYYNNQI